MAGPLRDSLVVLAVALAIGSCVGPAAVEGATKSDGPTLHDSAESSALAERGDESVAGDGTPRIASSHGLPLPVESSPDAAGESSAESPAELVAESSAGSDLPPEVDRPRLGIFVSPRTTIVYAEPAWGTEIRGRIDPDAPFWASAEVEGVGCEESRWVAVELGGYVCLKHAVESDEEPARLPRLPEGQIVPFIYAKPRQDRQGTLDAEIPRYRSYRHLRRGRGQVDSLVANRLYAFVERIWRPSVGHIFVDAEGRAVAGKSLRVQQPSDFFGRDLEQDPPAPGLTAGWAVSIPTLLRDKPSLRRRSKEIGSIAYHERFDVDPEPILGSGVHWYRIPGAGKEGADAYAEAKQVRVWKPGPVMAGVGDDELWIDVDIKQQILALRRGEHTLFITLVSTGTGSNPTPRGIFRIRNKLALGKMQNKPEDPDSYYVEAVPWVQYFYRRYAFHATYWHRGLGRRRSHGCINLAPRDAAYIFAQTTPNVPKGWTTAYEYADVPGTVVRIRRGDDKLVDHRRSLSDEVDGADAGE